MLSQVILKEEKVMACANLEGNNYVPIRLLFDGTNEAVQDARIELDRPNAQGNFTGRFKDLASGAVIDQLTNGHCERVNQIDTISFTRNHDDGSTTQYTGRVITLQGATDVYLRGRFTRTTITPASPVTTMSGDYETEKPT